MLSNLCMNTGTNLDYIITRAPEYWSLESQKYNYEDQSCSSGICTHYTQVIVINLIKIICTKHPQVRRVCMGVTSKTFFSLIYLCNDFLSIL